MKSSAERWNSVISLSYHKMYPSLTEKVFLLYNGIAGDADFDVVLVHGLGSGEFQCWTNERGLLWPAVFLPQDFQRCRILSVGYSHTLWQWASPANVEQVRKHREEQEEGKGDSSIFHWWGADTPGGINSSSELRLSKEDVKKTREILEISSVNETQLPHLTSPMKEKEEETLEHCAKDLAKRILSNSVGVGRRPVVFITHSLGGLVVKQMILSLELSVSSSLEKNHDNEDVSSAKLLLSSLRGIVFYATPHFGAPIASVVTILKHYYQRLGGIGPSEVIATLGDYNKEYLSNLNKQFFRVIEHCGKSGFVNILSFGETRRVNGIIRIVEPESANPTLDDERFPFYLLDVDHFEVNCPVSKDQPNYTILFAFIERMRRNGLLHSGTVKDENFLSEERLTLERNKETVVDSHFTMEEVLFNSSFTNHNGNNIFVETYLLLTSLEQLTQKLRAHSVSLFGCMMPTQLEKLLSLVVDVFNYASASSTLLQKEIVVMLNTPLQLLRYWLERTLATLQTVLLRQAEGIPPPLCNLSTSERGVLDDMDYAVVILRSEWEWCHTQLNKACISNNIYPDVLFFSHSIIVAVANTMEDDCGSLITLAMGCIQETFGWQRNVGISWAMQETSTGILTSASAMRSFLTGWFCCSISRKYEDAAIAFRRFARDIAMLQRDSYSAKPLINSSKEKLSTKKKEVPFFWWWESNKPSDKVNIFSKKKSNTLFHAFELLAYASLCWCQIRLNQRIGVLLPPGFSDASTQQIALHRCLVEGRHRYSILEHSLDINNVTDRPFFSAKGATTSSNLRSEEEIHEDIVEEQVIRSFSSVTGLAKSDASWRNFPFAFESAEQQEESIEKMRDRFVSSVMLFWWIMERRVEFHAPMENMISKKMNRTQDIYNLESHSNWVWEKAHPQLKSHWLTWRFVECEDADKNHNKTNSESFRLLTDALQLYPHNTLAQYLMGQNLFLCKQLKEAANAYISVLESTRCLFHPINRAAAVGLGWAHLHQENQHNSSWVPKSSSISSVVDTLSLYSAPEGLKEWWRLENFPRQRKREEVSFRRVDSNEKSNHLERASALFKMVLSLDPCNKGALCGMGRVKMLTTGNVSSFEFSDASRCFAAVLRDTDTKGTKSRWDEGNNVVAMKNGVWESRAAYWLGEIARCSIPTDPLIVNKEESSATVSRQLWEFAVTRCPENDWALTSLGLLYTRYYYDHVDSNTIAQRDKGVELLQRAFVLNAKNTWTLWGLAQFATDPGQRHMCRHLLTKLLRK
ncbi:putative protein SERAC1-like [Trypanosoma theileri]|uniref:DUF676 domain-containing protein n=1 Tax=Trypanosoma theileri TaxID=67003 RepID=A0A1X0P0H3_9TRYP|nr:putative protein SERAC1-like [Trypanosoma theileri]ORC89910.1 putative protein SERAC1-like [Trypanosoma theileri]